MTQGPSENHTQTTPEFLQLKFEALNSPTLRGFKVESRAITDRPSIRLIKDRLKQLHLLLPESGTQVHVFGQVWTWYLRTNPGMDAFGFAVQAVQFLHRIREDRSHFNGSDSRSPLQGFSGNDLAKIFRAIPDIGRVVGFGDDVNAIMCGIDWPKLSESNLERLGDARIVYNGQLPVLPPIQARSGSIKVPGWLFSNGAAKVESSKPNKKTGKTSEQKNPPKQTEELQVVPVELKTPTGYELGANIQNLHIQLEALAPEMVVAEKIEPALNHLFRKTQALNGRLVSGVGKKTSGDTMLATSSDIIRGYEALRTLSTQMVRILPQQFEEMGFEFGGELADLGRELLLAGVMNVAIESPTDINVSPAIVRALNEAVRAALEFIGEITSKDTSGQPGLAALLDAAPKIEPKAAGLVPLLPNSQLEPGQSDPAKDLIAGVSELVQPVNSEVEPEPAVSQPLFELLVQLKETKAKINSEKLSQDSTMAVSKIRQCIADAGKLKDTIKRDELVQSIVLTDQNQVEVVANPSLTPVERKLIRGEIEELGNSLLRGAYGQLRGISTEFRMTMGRMCFALAPEKEVAERGPFLDRHLLSLLGVVSELAKKLSELSQ